MSKESIIQFFQRHAIKGFLADDEGIALYEACLSVASLGSCLEVGSYCGKSTVFLGQACKEAGTTLYAVDHHRGSEEHQFGEEYHDPDLYDNKIECVDSFPLFRKTIALAEMEDVVVPIVAPSSLTVKNWQTPLSFVFIDGGHSHAMAMDDCTAWAEKIAVGGVLAVHDLFELPSEGGQGPYLAFEQVFASGRFEKLPQVQSLGFLRRVS